MNLKTLVLVFLVMSGFCSTGRSDIVVVTIQKHSHSIELDISWRDITVTYTGTWERTTIIYETAIAPGNNLPILAGTVYSGATTDFSFFSDAQFSSEITLLNATGLSQTYTVDSGLHSYMTGPLQNDGTATISVSDLAVNASLDTPDVLGTGDQLQMEFVQAPGSGTIYLGLPDDPAQSSATVTGLDTSFRLLLPNSTFAADQVGHIGNADLGGTFHVVPEPDCAIVMLLPLITIFVSRRRVH